MAKVYQLPVNRNLKALRAKHGLTQEEMAKAIGMSPMTYNRKENGKHDFTASECIRIAEYFDASPAEIFFAN